ncbi:MAG: hypothetical protein HY560_10515 [Gemmatimonadetes bacterium]|nr:hypothetical protein [Gemmatimonadota bacterium]
MRTAMVAFFALASSFFPGAGSLALAQAGPSCLVTLDSAGRATHLEVRPGVVHQFAAGGVWARCKDEPTAMRSDSVAWYSDLNRVDLVGRVHFVDTTVKLDAHRASYFLRTEMLDASGNVVLTNRRTGSTLRGPNLKYYRRVAALRDTSELYATARPAVEYRGENDSAGAEPYVIHGDRVRFKGNNLAWAGGSVTIDRSDFAAAADSAVLDLDAGGGEFMGQARVRGRGRSEYELVGRTVRYRMRDRKLEWVQARGSAEAKSADWRLAADTIEFDVADQRIQNGRAWGDSARPHANSATYTILADSLALDAPDQRLTELRGFGRAYATSRHDSLETDVDWMAGDTVVARFDTLANGVRILSRITARGNARAFYRVPDPDRPGAPPGITYSRGTRIAAKFTPLGLDRVDVVGAGDGVYLEPAPELAQPAPDSAKPATVPPPAVKP